MGFEKEHRPVAHDVCADQSLHCQAVFDGLIGLYVPGVCLQHGKYRENGEKPPEYRLFVYDQETIFGNLQSVPKTVDLFRASLVNSFAAKLLAITVHRGQSGGNLTPLPDCFETIMGLKKI